MWGFSKESSVDVLDLPELNRRKLINLPKQELESTKVTSDGFFDLSSQSTIQEQNPVSEGITDFLSDFASIGASNPNITPPLAQNQNSEGESVKDLKWRIENLEFKLEQLTEKLNSLNP